MADVRMQYCYKCKMSRDEMRVRSVGVSAEAVEMYESVNALVLDCCWSKLPVLEMPISKT